LLPCFQIDRLDRRRHHQHPEQTILRSDYNAIHTNSGRYDVFFDWRNERRCVHDVPAASEDDAIRLVAVEGFGLNDSRLVETYDPRPITLESVTSAIHFEQRLTPLIRWN
jgi:hypothetical protein